MTWNKTTDKTPPLYESGPDEIIIPNEELLLVHYIPYDSFELAVYVKDELKGGFRFELPNVGFATLEQVDLWLKIPQP